MECYGGQASQSCECVCYDGLFAGENCLGTFGLQYTIMCLLAILIWCQLQYNMVKVLLNICMRPDFTKSVLMPHFKIQIFITKMRNENFPLTLQWLQSCLVQVFLHSQNRCTSQQYK